MTIICLWNHQLPLRGFVFFLQAWSRPRSRALDPRYHGGAAWRRLSSESVCCCCTGCCCITAASQRAAGRCCTCTTRWSLLSETRWGRSPSWARAKVQTHTDTHTVFCEVKCLKNSNKFKQQHCAGSWKITFKIREDKLSAVESLQGFISAKLNLKAFSFYKSETWTSSDYSVTSLVLVGYDHE